jgi:hypothetical protein
MRILLVLATLACASSCRTFTRPTDVRVVEEGKLKVVNFDATRRATYVVLHSDGSVRIAAEPPPDVALSILASLAAKFSVPGGVEGVDGSASVDEDAVELAGRTTLVLIHRDLLFRLAEMYANGAIDEVEYQALYKDVLAAGKALADAGVKSAEAKLIQSKVRALEAFPENERPGMRKKLGLE